MPDPFRRAPNGGQLRGPIPRNGQRPFPRPASPPPGGSAGAAQQTQAAQLGTVLFAPGFGRGPTRPRTKKPGAPRRVPRRARARKSRRGKARLVKGSPAAKRFMAKLRRMQKRKGK